MRSILPLLSGLVFVWLIGCGQTQRDPAGDSDTRPDYYDRRPIYDNQPNDNDRHFETVDK
ncbi:MAG TPA: hypothetical protein VLI90_00260 [Tepidisphaeraceae bacterium]|nr:hypothetical protein [Tepidisphaeraceae bacterium]